MTAKEKEVAEEYSNALADLNINSKPLINMLTMLAEENSAYAPIIVQCIERQLHKVQADSKLPVLYLIDSVIKNIGQPYIPLFVQNIEKLFASTFVKVDEKTRANMYKLRSTWNDVIPPTKLHALDVAINAIDKNWPVCPAPPNIHVNPKFLNNVNHTEIPKPVLHNEVDEATLREKFIKKQKELLELQQKKLELELLQTRNQIELRKKKSMLKTSSNTNTSSSNTNVSPSNEELYSKIQTLSENSRKNIEDSVKTTDVLSISSESPSVPIKVIASPSKKFQSTSISTVQQPFKNSQSLISPQQQQQHTQVVTPSPFFSVNQQVPKINPVSTQLLQTLNRDPRLRKAENPAKSSNDDIKLPILKNKEDKKFEKPKKETNNKHRDSKRKERSPSNLPSKKEHLRKSYKKTDHKERSSREDKYKKRDDKKSKDPEIKKKIILSNAKVQQNEIETINHELPVKREEKSLKEETKIDNHVMDPLLIEKNVPKDKDVIIETSNEIELYNTVNLTSGHINIDSPLEDSDSLKRLHMYMQTMKKSPEPSNTPLLELKNDSNIRAIKTNQSKIKTSEQVYFIIQFIVGDLLLFLNKLDIFLRRNNMKTISPFHKVLSY